MTPTEDKKLSNNREGLTLLFFKDHIDNSLASRRGTKTAGTCRTMSAVGQNVSNEQTATGQKRQRQTQKRQETQEHRMKNRCETICETIFCFTVLCGVP